MVFREDKLIRAILDDDIASAKKLLCVSGVRRKMGYVFSLLRLGRRRRSSLLHLAAYANSVEIARLLIDNGEGVNSANGTGDTPLHVAARYNAWETADLLIYCGARIHIPNHADQTPRDVAVSCGNSNVAELLELVASG